MISQVGLNWFRVLVNPDSTFNLNVIWDASVPVGQLLALHEDSAVGWMTKESFINFSQRKVSLIFKTSRQLLRPAQTPISSILRANSWARKQPLISVWHYDKECVDPCVLYFHIPLYPHCVVLSETWRQHYLF
jgi:hypothetical protein